MAGLLTCNTRARKIRTHARAEGASKAMGHDMQGLMHMVACVIEEKIQDVYFPLTCTLDFRGFRIYGTAAMPPTTAAAQDT
jgi:hypothetical protein